MPIQTPQPVAELPVMNIDEILLQAIMLDSTVERQKYLHEQCGDDRELRAQVESLLEAHQQAGSFLQGSPASTRSTTLRTQLSEKVGSMIGRYKLLQEIGEGGFGIVFMAEQQQPIRRKVALKIIKPGMDSKEVIARFEAERQALAMMDHPNIAHVLDGGTTETGRPYFVMELVKGKALTEYCDANKLDVRDRLALHIAVCQAVQHAHSKGVIHRDLKPSNVMVTLHDGKPVVKVIDFGVSKALNQQLTERTMFTAYGQMVGTPRYMSPEQAEMSGLDVDTRSDVYSLGVLLYELLTGSTPLTDADLRSAAYADIQRMIREQEPPKPSTRISTAGAQLTIVAAHRSETPQRLHQLVRGDLDLIVMKALEKDRTRRYETAAGFANDIEHYLNDEPVKACPPSTSYRMWKFYRRNRSLVTAASLLAVMLLIGIAGTTTGWIQAMLVSQQLEEKAGELAQQGKELREQKDMAVVGQAREHSLRQQAENDRGLAEEARSRAEKNLYVAEMQLAHHALSRPHAGIVENTLERWMPDPGKPDLRGWEWYYLLSESRKDVVWTLRDHELPVLSVTWANDNVRFASLGENGTVRIWDVRTGREVAQLAITDPNPTAVRWSPDGSTIATAHPDGTIQLWDGTSYEEKGKLEKHEMSVRGGADVVSIDFSRDGRILASYGWDQTVRIWDIDDRQQLHAISVGTPWKTESDLAVQDFFQQVTLSPDGKLLGVVTDRSCALWDVETEQKVRDLGADFDLAGRCIAWSPNGTQIAVGGVFDPFPCYDILVLDVETGKETCRFQGHRESVNSVKWDSLGDRIVTTGRDHTVRIWDATTGTVLKILQGHQGFTWDASFCPNGQYVVSGADDGTVRVWQSECSQMKQQPLGDESTRLYRVTWGPDGRRLAVSGSDGAIRIVDAQSRECVMTLRGHALDVIGVTWSPDGKRLASTSLDKSARVWDAVTGEELQVIKDHDAEFVDAAWSPDSLKLATVGWNRMLNIWDTASGDLCCTFEAHHDHLFAVEWSRDGKYLAYTTGLGLEVVECETKKMVVNESVQTFTNGFGLAFSPVTPEIAYAKGHDVVILGLDASVIRRTLTGHTADILSISWEGDGRRLATSSADGTIRIWDADFGQELLTIGVSSEVAYSVAWSPNGQMLVSSGANGDVQYWDASKGYQQVSDPTFINWQTKRQLREAQELSKAGSHERADFLLTEVLKWKPEDAEVLWVRAAVRARMGRYQDAVDGFARVHDVNPERVGALYATALLRLRLHDRDGFLRELGRLLDDAMDPNDQRMSGCVWLCMLDAQTVRELPRAKDIVDRIYEASKTDSSLDYYAYLIDIRRGNPDREPMPAAEDRSAVQQAVDGLWESIRLIELDRRPESRVHYDRARRLLATARENVTGGQWWWIVTAEILARELEQRLEIAPE